MNVLIDDDKLMHLGWELKAEKAGLKLRSFFSVDEFISAHNDFDPSTNIYIDSDLKQDSKGELEAKKLYDLGFQNLFLVTGYTHLSLKEYPWLKAILPKNPPF